MKNVMFLLAAVGTAIFLVSSQTTPAESELTISNTKERIWIASQSRNS